MTYKGIYPIIVTYYSELTDCKTYQSLLSHWEGRRFLIYDNSPTRINGKYKSSLIDYFGDGINRGVSSAYNYGCKLAEEKGFKYILLLDEDTILEENFFKKLSCAIENNDDIDVFAPSIYYQEGKPFSPSICSLLKIKGVDLTANHSYPLTKYMPVNSGTCIRISVFKKANGYKEAIKMDFADFDFFQRLSSISSHFMLIESKAYQNFSNEETDINKLKRRYTLYLEGALATSHRHKFLLHIIRHTLALTIRTKQFIFINIFLKTFFLRII